MRAFLLGVSVLVLLGILGFFVASSATRSLDFSIPVGMDRELPQGGFYVGNYPTVSDLNPFTTNAQVALSCVLRYTHDCLMRLDVETRELAPAVAQVVESSADGLTHTFELRENVRFSNGDPVTVEDIRFTFDVVNDKSVKPGSIHDSVGKISVFLELDDRRFKILLRERHFNGLAGMAIGYRVVQKKWFMDQIAIAANRLDRDVPSGPGAEGFGELLNGIRHAGPGTGPYEIARTDQNELAWIQNRELWLVQNLGSWHRMVFPRRWNLAGFGLRFDGRSSLTQLKQQKIDWDLPMKPDELLDANPELKKNYAVHRYDSAVLGHYAITWNCERVPKDVRKALSMLFDREFIRDDILGGSATLVDSWFRAADPEHPKNARPIPFDVKLARLILEQHGYGPGGKRLEIRIIAAISERNRSILEVAKDAFASAGVSLDPALMEDKAAQAEIDKKTDRRFDGSLSFWRHPSLSIDPYVFFHSAGGLNEGRYSNPKVDSLLERARTTLELDDRVKLYHEFHTIVREEQPVTLLVHPINTLLLHRRFHDVNMGWGGAVPAHWWVDVGQRIHYANRSR